jgi:hypothetical protein
MVAMRGMWSDVGRKPEVSEVPGKMSLKGRLKKALSKRARVGLERLLVQV